MLYRIRIFRSEYNFKVKFEHSQQEQYQTGPNVRVSDVIIVAHSASTWEQHSKLPSIGIMPVTAFMAIVLGESLNKATQKT
jgi:hypothetical protein